MSSSYRRPGVQNPLEEPIGAFPAGRRLSGNRIRHVEPSEIDFEERMDVGFPLALPSDIEPALEQAERASVDGAVIVRAAASSPASARAVAGPFRPFHTEFGSVSDMHAHGRGV